MIIQIYAKRKKSTTVSLGWVSRYNQPSDIV